MGPDSTNPSLDDITGQNLKDGRRLNGFHRDRSLLKRASSLGGRSAHQNEKTKRCHEFNSEKAREAANKRWGKC